MRLTNDPGLLFFVSLLFLAISTQIGDKLRSKVRPLAEEELEDFRVVLGASLTLLGLLIGFSFSMAISRYDLRKNYEETEANAIGTEYVRADLLPAENAARLRELLRNYTRQRVLFYSTSDKNLLPKIDRDTAGLQSEMWAAVLSPMKTQPTAVDALVISGMNDVLNAQGYTQAAWWNRIPIAAWTLMSAIAIVCNLLVGYGARRKDWRVFFVLPLAISISFFLIADIDSPRGGGIRVAPQNLLSLSQSWHAPSTGP
jgi:hypothetical protein